MTLRFGRAVATAATGAAAMAAMGLAARPWFLRWGATDEENGKAWPGDELSPNPRSEATRAITIHAPAAAVWPWLVQIGQDRGGFYSYSWLENLVGAKIRNADRILPEHQILKVGDTIWMTPRERYRGMGCVRVARLDAGRALVTVTPDDYDSVVDHDIAPHGTWAFVLDSVDDRTTRLIVRSRSGSKLDPFRVLVFDPIHFIMERKKMLGIRRRVEAAAARPVVQTACS